MALHQAVLQSVEAISTYDGVLGSAFEYEAAPAAKPLDYCLRRLAGRSRIERRLGVVLYPELYHLGGFGPELAARQSEGHVDTGRHARRGDYLAFDHDALRHGLGAQLAEYVRGGPVAVRSQPFQQTGRPEYQRACAHGGRPLRAFVYTADPSEGRLIIHQGHLSRPSGDDQNVGRRDLVERVIGHQREAARIRANRPALPGHELDRGFGSRSQDFVRPDRVEGREPVKDKNRYFHSIASPDMA